MWDVNDSHFKRCCNFVDNKKWKKINWYKKELFYWTRWIKIMSFLYCWRTTTTKNVYLFSFSLGLGFKILIYQIGRKINGFPPYFPPTHTHLVENTQNILFRVQRRFKEDLEKRQEDLLLRRHIANKCCEWRKKLCNENSQPARQITFTSHKF